MRRYAVLVDAGYLLMGGAVAVLGVGERAEATVQHEKLIAWIIDKSGRTILGSELLRLYWYDGSPQKLPTSEHLTVAEQPDTKLRLGYLTHGGQKGVDALIFSDMIELARCGAVVDVILLAGDGDHLEAVERAQALGIRVHLWGIETDQGSVSPELRRAADRTELLAAAELSPFFARSPPPPVVRPPWMDSGPVESSTARGGDGRHAGLRTYSSVDLADARQSGRRFAKTWRPLATSSQVDEVTHAERPSIPQAIDGRLLRYACDDLGLPAGAELSTQARIEIRAGFWDGFDDTSTA